MSDERAFDESDIALVKEHLNALDAQIIVPDAASSEKLLEKMNNAPKKRGKILSFRTVSTVAAAVIVIAVLTVAWRGLFPGSDTAPRMMAAGSAENGAEEEAAESPAEAPAPASEAESYSVAVTGESGEIEAASETDKMESLSQDTDEYSAVRETLEGMFESGDYSQSASAQWADEDVVETKYRLVDIEDDGGSVSVLIYDKENGNELFAALWVQGDYYGAQQSDDGRTLTVTTRMKAEESDLESGEFIPVYSDESGSPVRISAEDITIKEVCSEPVFTIMTTVDLESGGYTVTAVLG